jgi:hypothetical protein
VHNPVPADFIMGYGEDTPGGTDNRRMWNEKGVLDTLVHECAQPGPAESLKPNNDPFKVGIYAQNHLLPDYD